MPWEAVFRDHVLDFFRTVEAHDVKACNIVMSRRRRSAYQDLP